MSDEIIQNVAYNNYDDFQHINFRIKVFSVSDPLQINKIK